MSEIPMRRKFSRHIDIRRYFVRELIKAGFVKLITLPTHKMVDDALTKSLRRQSKWSKIDPAPNVKKMWYDLGPTGQVEN